MFAMQKVFWLHALETREELVDLAAESVLLSTLALIGSRALRALPALTQSNGNFALVKAYIDEHFCDPALCMEQISDYFSYNKKYISTLFKKQMKVGISEYIRTLRLIRAAELLEAGEQSIAEIASLSGFNDMKFFYKVFKQTIGSLPSEYRENH